jgi:cell division protein FtsB
MTRNENILLSISILLLIVLFIYIVFSKNGYSDLTELRQERNRLVQKNEQLTRENRAISIEIDRLKNDLSYIESIARQELGMIRKDEIILKSRNRPDREK